MGEVAELLAERAQPYAAARFEAFRITEAGDAPYGGPPPRTTFPLGDVPASTLDEALNAVVGKCVLSHKDHVAIRETTERGTRTHLFVIKRRSVPHYRWEGAKQVRVQPLYPDPVCVMDGALGGGQ